MDQDFHREWAAAKEDRNTKSDHARTLAGLSIKLELAPQNLIDLPNDYNLPDAEQIRKAFRDWNEDVSSGKNGHLTKDGYGFFVDRSIDYTGFDYFLPSLSNYNEVVRGLSQDERKFFNACLTENIRNRKLAKISTTDKDFDASKLPRDFYVERAACRLTYLAACQTKVRNDKGINNDQLVEIIDLYQIQIAAEIDHIMFAQSRDLFKMRRAEQYIKNRLIDIALDNPELKGAISALIEQWDEFKGYAKPHIKKSVEEVKDTCWHNQCLHGADKKNHFSVDIANNFKLQQACAKLRTFLKPKDEQISWHRPLDYCTHLANGQAVVCANLHDFVTLGEKGMHVASALLQGITRLGFNKWELDLELFQSEDVMKWLAVNGDKRTHARLKASIAEYFCNNSLKPHSRLRPYLGVPDRVESEEVEKYFNNLQHLREIKAAHGIECVVAEKARTPTHVRMPPTNNHELERSLIISNSYSFAPKIVTIISLQKAESKLYEEFKLDKVLPSSIEELSKSPGVSIGYPDSVAISHARIHQAYEISKPDTTCDAENLLYLDRIGIHQNSCFLFYFDSTKNDFQEPRRKKTPDWQPVGSF